MPHRSPGKPLKVFLIAGETSGDHLGAELMGAVRRMRRSAQFTGVGGGAMAAEGLKSLFPIADIAVMGFLPVIARLPSLLARIRQTAKACIDEKPDVLVIIDSPDFTHRVAKRVRAAAPAIPIINYVSPTVWAWRPGRAAAMRSYIDHVLAVLPFEPEAHRRLNGPACTYVGHPLTERYDVLRPSAEEARRRETEREVLVLPGSRGSEVRRMLPVFGKAMAIVAAAEPDAGFSLPVAPHVTAAVRKETARWALKPRLLFGEGPKFAAFRAARAAMAASGTVTLELGLSGVPMVAAYRISLIEAEIARRVIKVPSVILPNLILNEAVTPELLQTEATPENIAAALIPLLRNGPERQRQLDAFRRLDRAMSPGFGSPATLAGEIVIELAEKGRIGAAAA